MSNYIVYLHTNRNTNKSYIGATSVGIEKRWYHHVHASVNNSQNHLHRSIRKHGEECWESSVLFVAFDRESMFDAEKKLIQDYDTLNNGYNMTEGGDSGPILYGKDNGNYGNRGEKSPLFGTKHTEEQNKKNSEAVLGHWENNPERRKAVSKHFSELAKKRTGAKNAAAVTYIFTDPDGTDHTVVGGFVKFCKGQGWYSVRVRKAAREDGVVVAYGKDTGWKVRKV